MITGAPIIYNSNGFFLSKWIYRKKKKKHSAAPADMEVTNAHDMNQSR